MARNERERWEKKRLKKGKKKMISMDIDTFCKTIKMDNNSPKNQEQRGVRSVERWLSEFKTMVMPENFKFTIGSQNS